MMLLIHLSIIFYKNKLVHGFYFHNTSPANFYLLHTHFFSLLVYHVPILSYNPTVYTLYTVSTWGSVYVGQYDSWFCNQCAGDCYTLLLAAGKIVRHIIQFIFQPQHHYNIIHKLLIYNISIQFHR